MLILTPVNQSYDALVRYFWLLLFVYGSISLMVFHGTLLLTSSYNWPHICRKKEPPMVQVERDRWVYCWLFAEEAAG